MLRCCNNFFKGFFYYTLNNNSSFYRRIEYGVCPQCGIEIFRDFKQFQDGTELLREYKGQKAKSRYNQWIKLLNNTKYGSYSNQNYYYGEHKKIKKKNGAPVFIQLRKNFNNQTEILGKVVTKIYLQN